MERKAFVFLDGIRGIAALLVVMTHAPNFFMIWKNHTYLAVDIFFILSGFVIALAYENKLITKKLTFSEFVKKRFVRLYPIYFVSLCIAFFLAVIAGYLSNNNVLLWAGYTAILTAFLIPRNDGSMMFTLNTPYWSLFYEFIVNFLYAAIAPFLTTRLLILIVSIAGSSLAYIAYINGHLNLGWGNTEIHYASGLSRSIFGILMGVLLYRFRDRLIKNVSFISPWFAVAVIVSALLIPKLSSYNFLYDILIVTVVFPFTVLVASQLKKSKFDPALLMLGAASYPLYVLHYPVIHFTETVLESYGYGYLISQYAPYTGIALLVFLVALSLFMAKYVEMPIRLWLSGFLERNERKQVVRSTG
ncbi:acyltransferase family protein [Methylophaga sp.]|uniref:acyltransferase family protein n=1 Tax=Methylophaga sp. TaxID=2024840 RepID=UPI003A90FD45